MRNLIGLFFIVVSLYSAGQKQQKKVIEVGDKAPSLFIQEWVKGTPVTEFKQGEIYVVEFSGTWCPPCRKAIPHLTELSKRYGDDLKLISVYAERNNKEDFTDLSYLEKIHALVNAMGEKMGFIVAADVPQKKTIDSWGVTGLPTAFLVDTSGRIAWKGDPMDLSPILAQIVAGTFNAEIALMKQEEFNNYLNSVQKTKKEGDYLTALKGLDSLIGTNPEKKPWLFIIKFEFLAGDDDKQAYEWVEWILNNKIEGFDWPHFVGEFGKIASENRNYQIELKSLDKAIEESETQYHTAYPLSLKAETYVLLGDYKNAIKCYKQAIANSKASGGNVDETMRYEKKLKGLKEKRIP